MSQRPSTRGPCPYCRESARSARYANREHVIPQSFGRFDENLIAWNVCDECNAHFDKELDRILARGTYEGFMRFKLGDKAPRDYKHVGDAAKIRFEAKEGPWKGMHLHQRVSADGQALMAEPAKQIGFAKAEKDQPTYYQVADAPDKARCIELFGDEVFVRTVGFASPEEVRTALLSLGFTQIGELQSDWSVVTESTTIRTEQIATADRLVFRAVTKIAVNFLDSLFPQLSRMATFSAICDYVRFDRDPELRPVTPSFRPIIGNEPDGHRFLGHIVTLRHDSARNEVLARVSLYNQVRYDIVLAPTGFLADVPREFMTCGRLFDTKNHTIHDLTHESQIPGKLLIDIDQ